MVITPLSTSVALNSPYKTTRNIKHVQSKSLPRATVNLSAVKNRREIFFCLLPTSVLLRVIQCSNKRIVGERQSFFGCQSVSLLNFLIAKHIAQYSPNLIATWNPPYKWGFHMYHGNSVTIIPVGSPGKICSVAYFP